MGGAAPGEAGSSGRWEAPTFGCSGLQLVAVEMTIQRAFKVDSGRISFSMELAPTIEEAAPSRGPPLRLEPMRRSSSGASAAAPEEAEAVVVEGGRCVVGRAGGASVISGVTTLNVSREQAVLERVDEGWVLRQRGMNPSCVVTADGVFLVRQGESRRLDDGDAVALDGKELMARASRACSVCDAFRVRTAPRRSEEAAALLAAKDAEIRALKRKLEEVRAAPGGGGGDRPEIIPIRESPPPVVRVRARFVGGATRAVEVRGETVGSLRAALEAADAAATRPLKVIWKQRVLGDDAAALAAVGLAGDDDTLHEVVVVPAPPTTEDAAGPDAVFRFADGTTKDVFRESDAETVAQVLARAAPGHAATFRGAALDGARALWTGFNLQRGCVVDVAPAEEDEKAFRVFVRPAGLAGAAATPADVAVDVRGGDAVQRLLDAVPGAAAVVFNGRRLAPTETLRDVDFVAKGSVFAAIAAPTAPPASAPPPPPPPVVAVPCRWPLASPKAYVLFSRNCPKKLCGILGRLVEDLGGSVDAAVRGDRYEDARVGRGDGCGCAPSGRTTHVVVSDDEALRRLRCRDGAPGRRGELLGYLGLAPTGGDVGDRLWFVAQGWLHACRGGRAREDDYLAMPGLTPSVRGAVAADDDESQMDLDEAELSGEDAPAARATVAALEALREDAAEAGDVAARVRGAAAAEAAASLADLRPSARYTGLRRLEGEATSKASSSRPASPRPLPTRAHDAAFGPQTRVSIPLGKGAPATLRGPRSRVRDLLALCAHVRSLSGEPPRDRLAPVFVFSRGRPASPYLDMDRPSAFGPPCAGALRHSWLVVVDPTEVEAYASRHPDALFLVLPEAGRKVSSWAGKGRERGQLQRLLARSFSTRFG